MSFRRLRQGSSDRSILLLDINGLYILLTEQEVVNRWHWCLYLHLGLSRGWIFHITRPTNFWFYDQRTEDSVIYSESTIAVLKIADIHPDVHPALRDRLSLVPLEDTRRFGDLTCRTWLMRALDDLDNEGYISISEGSTVENIEQEAKDVAIEAISMSWPITRRSNYSYF